MSFGLKAWYRQGDIDRNLDVRIKDAAAPGVWWAQGYNFSTGERDIAFDYGSEAERRTAMRRIKAIARAHAEPKK